MEKGMMKKIKKYKKMVGCTMEQATIAVMYNKMQRRNVKKASICPECGKPTLEIQSDDREYGNEYWVACDNCDFNDDVDNYEPLQHWYTFDELLCLCDNPRQYGYSKKQWKELIRENTKKKREELAKCS